MHTPFYFARPIRLGSRGPALISDTEMHGREGLGKTLLGTSQPYLHRH